MKRRTFLLSTPAAAAALGGCSNLVTAPPEPAKNYKINLLHKGPPAIKYSSVQRGCRTCDAFESLYVEEETLLSSDHPPIRRWRDQVFSLRDLSQLEQVEGVNTAVNRDIRYESDYRHWHVRDKWGFPVESLEEGGDCEDFALLKFESLKLLGWSEEAMMVLVGVSDFNGKKESHATLLVEMEDRSQLVLDSLTDFISPPRDDHHFYPMYGINPAGYYHVEV